MMNSKKFWRSRSNKRKQEWVISLIKSNLASRVTNEKLKKKEKTVNLILIALFKKIYENIMFLQN